MFFTYFCCFMIGVVLSCFCSADRHAHATDEEKKATEVKFKEVGEAYAVLTDPKKRFV